MFMYKSRPEGFLKPNSTEEYPNCHLSTWYPEQVEEGVKQKFGFLN